ncbi:unnamed protein product [Orchesella dallaii]|uniref:Failed axon connections n=1 Tax=Orchesella dallaii TaxID=48710 RepID=A0ABP1QB12_9HEXA
MEKFKELVSPQIRDYVAATVVTVGGFVVVTKVSGAVIRWISAKCVERRWKNTPKDVVILHRIPPAIAAPNASPFVIKLETYLRMTNIPYEIDLGDGMGPKGKTPWITLNGQHVSDSQLCIEFLAKKFEKRVGNYSDEERAIGTMARLMMDEHFYWGLLMWRYVYSLPKGLGPDKIFSIPLPTFAFKLLLYLYVRRMIFISSWFQGIARHSEDDIVQIISDDLRALSKVLGNKKFILGDEPCEDDCAIFGELAQALWCMPGSPYEELLNGELQNLKEYCLRMKTIYWPDWENCIAQPRK